MLILILSPSSIRAIGPPAIASGEICPTHGPRVPPENLPSVIKATESDKFIPAIAAVGDSISLIPGPPFGPSYRMTTTSPLLISFFIMAFMPSSSELKTLAVPVKLSAFSLTADCFTTAPSGAKFPLRIAIPPSFLYGLLRGLMTSLSETSPLCAISFIFLPLVERLSLNLSFKTFNTPGIPPAYSRSSIKSSPPGRILVNCGDSLPNLSKSSSSNLMPAS